MKKPIFFAGLQKSGKTSLLVAFLQIAKERFEEKVVGAKFFDVGQSLNNRLDRLNDGEKILEVLADPPNINLISPYLAYGISPYELSFQEERIKIDWKLIEGNLKLLQKIYSFVLLETPPGLMMPITKEKTALDWMKEVSTRVVWVMSTEQTDFASNLSDLIHLKNNGFEVSVVLNNRNKVLNGDWLFYLWNKVEELTDFPVVGLIPYVDGVEGNNSEYRDKVFNNINKLLGTIFSS